MAQLGWITATGRCLVASNLLSLSIDGQIAQGERLVWLKLPPWDGYDRPGLNNVGNFGRFARFQLERDCNSWCCNDDNDGYNAGCYSNSCRGSGHCMPSRSCACCPRWLRWHIYSSRFGGDGGEKRMGRTTTSTAWLVHEMQPLFL
ncbi:hypothetical protein V8C34DRAFT_288268 [Trichoderma compactum]